MQESPKVVVSMEVKDTGNWKPQGMEVCIDGGYVTPKQI
jgi:hypothetical protein